MGNRSVHSSPRDGSSFTRNYEKNERSGSKRKRDDDDDLQGTLSSLDAPKKPKTKSFIRSFSLFQPSQKTTPPDSHPQSPRSDSFFNLYDNMDASLLLSTPSSSSSSSSADQTTSSLLTPTKKKMKSTADYIYNVLFVQQQNSDIRVKAFNKGNIELAP